MTDAPLPVGIDIVLNALCDGPSTAFEVVQATGITGPTIRRALDRITAEGWATVTETKGGSWGPRRTYRITYDGRIRITQNTEKRKP